MNAAVIEVRGLFGLAVLMNHSSVQDFLMIILTSSFSIFLKDVVIYI